MNLAEMEVVDDTPFFAPVPNDLVDGLLGQYQSARARIAEVTGFIRGALYSQVIHYFIDGNTEESRVGRPAAEKLFDEDGAVAALNSAYWSKALGLTDVLDAMPQVRRNEWHQMIRDQKAPNFDESTVRATLTELLGMRQTFFAERVDGIFRALSGDHVTNVPEGFGRRMIIGNVLTSYGTVESSRVGFINDLRCVIAKFMGRDEPHYSASDSVVRAARAKRGEWQTVDGGALRIRVYLKGTAHLEVHPDMAYRLNGVLAHMHPLAIPAAFRAKPKKAPKDFEMMQRPLPFAVLALLAGIREVRLHIPGHWPERYDRIPNARDIAFGDADAAVRREAEQVLKALGGVEQTVGHRRYMRFDYDPEDVLAEVVASGCIPHQQAHQFYPTPERLAAIAAELAEIGPADTVLEPSAGQGGLAAFLPADRTTCVEISALHCAILRAKGFAVDEADFLLWADHHWPNGPFFDRIVMNPPFSDGRARAHLEAASTLVKPGGRLVAILPASMRGKNLAGFDCEWSQLYDNEFAGTSAAVVMLLAERAA
jgi:hypothetical protein